MQEELIKTEAVAEVGAGREDWGICLLGRFFNEFAGSMWPPILPAALDAPGASRRRSQQIAERSRTKE